MNVFKLLVASFLLVGMACSCGGQQDWSQFKPVDFSNQIESALTQIQKRSTQGPFQPNWKSLENYQVPEWYQDAKFGIFIHWGPYCVPEFGWEWYPRQMYIDKDTWRGNPFQHHRETYGNQKNFGYKDLIPQLTAEKFDAAEWAQLFREAGARYVVPVAEHHDGFAMYDCSFSQWTATQMGPKRDVVGELEKEVRKLGMHFGVSSHRAFNWLYYNRSKDFDNSDPRFAGLYGRPMPFLFDGKVVDYQKNWVPHDKQFKDEWLARTCELVDKYNPDIVWFDFGIANVDGRSPDENPFADHLKRFASYYYNHGENVAGRTPVINYKWTAFPEKAAVLDCERSKLDNIRDLFWQTDTSVSSNSWCYVKTNKYKPVNRIVDDLIDIVSKNGCLLLNVGPRRDGTIHPEEQKMLREIGAWMKVNGEAIYQSRPFKIFGEGPTGSATGHLSESKNKPFGPKDIRFTTRGDTLYAFVLDMPEDRTAIIESLKRNGDLMNKEIQSVELLGSDAELNWQQKENGLSVEIPKELPCKFAWVLKIR